MGCDELLTKVVRVSGYQLVMLEDTSRKFNVLQEHPEHAAPYVPMIGAGLAAVELLPRSPARSNWR